MERLGDMTLRDYMMYHYYYLHQGYRYGARRHQQRWLGHDIIKTPQDCWVYQEIIFETKPDVIIELGVMFGGATHFFASILDLDGRVQQVNRRCLEPCGYTATDVVGKLFWDTPWFAKSLWISTLASQTAASLSTGCRTVRWRFVRASSFLPRERWNLRGCY